MIPIESFRTFGAALKAARESANRNLDDIAASIRVNRRHLESIEAGDLDKLPQGPYVLAFIREYARAVAVPLPPEFAPTPNSVHASPKDPKVVSRPRPAEDRGVPLSQVARETAKLARTAVKTVSKTTENVVNLVESGSKEALEVLTSKSLWEEAENTRRERHGLPPIERPAEPPKRILEERPLLGAKQGLTPKFETIAIADEEEIEQHVREPIKVTKRATNIVIVALAVVFAAVAYFAVHLSKTESGNLAAKDYVPAPVEKPQPLTPTKRESAAPTHPALAPAVTAVKDSLQFTLRATQPVWVSIAPDGIPAYRGELKAGESHGFRAADKFVVNIGNQKSVAMTFDGQPLAGLPAVQGSNVVVRNLVLMRDRVTLDGNALDVSTLTHPPRAPVPAPIPVAVKPNTISSNASPSNSKSASATSVSTHGASHPSSSHPSSPHTPANGSVSKAGSKTTASSKTSKKKTTSRPTLPPGIIHPVEPIPPRP